MAHFKIEGIAEAMSSIKSLQHIAAPEMFKIVKKNGAELQQKEMRIVPVDTGNLKRSILLAVEDNGMTSTVEPTANYAGYVEYGTRFMDAQPYVRPSYEQQKEIFMKDMKKYVK